MSELENPAEADTLRGFEVRHGRSTTLSEAVAAEIESRILRGELPGGTRLPAEAQLVEMVGVSRSVVRDAVRTLVARGLLIVRQGDGTVVAEPNAAVLGDAMISLLMRCDLTMRDVAEGRAAIETEIGGLAAERGTAEDWGMMRDRLERFREAIAEEDWIRAHDSHLEFHLLIYRAVHLRALELMLAPMEQCILLTSLPPTSPDDLTQWEVDVHEDILRALERGDSDATRDALTVHFAFIDEPRVKAFMDTPFQRGAGLDDYRAFRDRPRRVA